MQLKDATRLFGRLGLLLPLTLIFLIAADSAYACPGHTSKVAYRTKAIKTRTGSHMPTSVISYRAPVSYRRCGANMYDTRGVRYVSVRGNSYNTGAKYVAVRGNGTRYVAIRGSGARYVAVLDDDDLNTPKLRRYGAVNDVDYGEAPRRFMTVRRPVYVESGTRYVAVRRVEPRTRYVAVRNIDIDDDDDEPRYVALRRHDPGVRYVAVRTAPRTRYIAVNNNVSGCTRAVALRSCLDEVETTSVKRVVLRNDNVSTKHVVLRDGLDDDDVAYINDVYSDDDNDEYITVADDDKYIAVASETPKYVEYRDATYSNANSATYIAANDFDNTCLRNVAVRTCHPDAVSTRTITYEVSDDNDVDDQVFLDRGGATYVAANDMEDACLSRQVVVTRPGVVTTEAVSYVPAAYVDDDASLVRSESRYIAAEQPASSWPRYVALDDDRVFNDLDPTWVAEVGEAAAAAVGTVPVEAIDTETVSYVPVDDAEAIDAETVSYVPVANTSVTKLRYIPVDDMDVETVSYVPVHNTDVTTVSYVPADSVGTTYVAADECPMLVSSVDAEPVYSTVLVKEVDAELVAGLHGTQRIAGGFGYRDGFEDGQEAALEGDLFHPENSGDFEKATEGYEDEFGDKDVYKDSYRSSYLAGYRAGFASGNSLV